MAETPISLYLDLEPGEIADLEVVAKAAIAFSEAIKETAFVLDPSLKLKILLASGTEGSLSLNAIIETARKGAKDHPVLAALIFMVVSWFTMRTLEWGFDKALDAAFGDAVQQVELTDEQLDVLAAKIVEAQERGVAKKQVQRIYEELDKDKAIKGVGATTKPGKRPEDIVPRAAFPERAGFTVTETDVLRRRERSTRETLVIVSPVLVDGNRRWRFRSLEGEWGASIKDESFLENLLSGRIAIPMRAGVELDVVLQTTEEWNGAVWVPTERTITHVEDVRPPPSGEMLFVRD